MESIGTLVRELENNYQSGTTYISEHVEFNLKDNISRIDAYLNSKHITGDTDSQGRPKPFFNIVTAATNIWFRATDIDRKNIHIKATKEADYWLAFLATIHLQEFMRKSAFGQFLNDWGRTLARYGSAIIKFIEKKGELYAKVIPWNTAIVDPVDFDNGPVIEKLYYTPAQLKKNESYDQDMVKKLLDSLVTRKTLDNTTKDTQSEFVEVYEIHGELPLSYLTDKETDEDTYQQQMHVISFVASKEQGKFDDFTLYAGKEGKNPYMITHLIKEDGRTQSIGAVEHLFEAQWMMNHSVKAIKDQLDLASKLIFQTSDGNYVGRNALTSIQNGDIMVHALNQPLTELNNTSHDITAQQAFGAQWQAMGNQLNGISEAMLGANQPAGSAWRQTQALLAESHSLFELMTENKGLDIENMMTTYIIDFLKKKMDTSEEISATMNSYQIKQIDSAFVPNEAVRRSNRKIIDQLLYKGQEAQMPDMAQMQNEVQADLNKWGNQRFIKPDDIPTKTWKEVLKDFEWEVEVDITGEQTDKQAVLDTLNTALQVVMNPNFAASPKAQLIVNRILSEVGTLSPIELSLSDTQPIVPAVGGPNMGQLPAITQQQNALR